MSEKPDVWWLAGSWSHWPSPVHVVSETAAMIVIQYSPASKRRVKKDSVDGTYFPTFSEARDHMVQRWQRKAEAARESLRGAEETVEALRALVDPTQG